MPSGTPITITDQVKSEIISKYLNGISAVQLAKQYGFKCSKSIAKILKNNNINIRSQVDSMQKLAIQFNEQEISEILSMNANPLLSLKDIARTFDRDPATIKYQLVKLGVYNSSKYDEYLIAKFKDIATEEQAYWLGFLAADGSISNNQKQLALQLAEVDFDHIIKFRNFIGVNYKISKSITNLNGELFTGYRYVISSLNFVRFLEKYALVPNKSLTLQFPTTIPDHLMRHYLRGLIDGDGSFSVNCNDRLQFSLVSSLEVCQMVQKILMQNCAVKETKLQEKIAKNGGKYYYLVYCGSMQCSRIATYLYNGSTIFLDRKKQFLSHFLINHKYGAANKNALII